MTDQTSPALRYRSPQYPPVWGDRVPKRVRMTKTVTSDFPMLLQTALIAEHGQVYDVWVNSYGAVTALIDGDRLGLKPDEFEVVEWHEQEPPSPDPVTCDPSQLDFVVGTTNAQRILGKDLSGVVVLRPEYIAAPSLEDLIRETDAATKIMMGLEHLATLNLPCDSPIFELIKLAGAMLSTSENELYAPFGKLLYEFMLNSEEFTAEHLHEIKQHAWRDRLKL